MKQGHFTARFWAIALTLVASAGIVVYLALFDRAEVTHSGDVKQCQVLDHLIQVQEYLTSASTTLNDRQKELRINIYENFRDEQAREISSQCRDPLDTDVIVEAVREAEGP